MPKITKSITIEKEVSKEIEIQAKKEGRNYSNMIEQMAKKYISENK